MAPAWLVNNTYLLWSIWKIDDIYSIKNINVGDIALCSRIGVIIDLQSTIQVFIDNLINFDQRIQSLKFIIHSTVFCDQFHVVYF